MSFVKKIYVNYHDCASKQKLQLPALITEKGILISHLRYLAWMSNKSPSWRERSTFSLQLLLKYINANSNFDSATKLLKAFADAVLIGTVDMAAVHDELNIYWRPRKKSDANSILFHINTYTDFLSQQEGYDDSRINPFRKATSYEERLNWCAYYNQQANVFLSHLTNKQKAAEHNKRVRLVGMVNDDVFDYEYATRFPNNQLDRLLYLGFNHKEKLDYKSQAMVMLMNYGGLRKSELFHIYVSDITMHPIRQHEAIVRVYHPEIGASPDPRYKNRQEYLTATTHYKPRNQYLISERLFSGWKSPLLTSKKGYFEVIFNPPEKAKDFLAIWANYLKYQRVEPKTSNPHPFAFTNSKGTPETLKNFQNYYRKAVERIGLEFGLKHGTSEHCHRHAYGFRLREAGLSQVEIQKAMHHKSPLSCLVYIKPTLHEVRETLRKAHE